MNNRLRRGRIEACCIVVPAFFKTAAAQLPQDEDVFWMASRKTLILRCFAQQSLEGRFAAIQLHNYCSVT
jgi:hypothetical protein